MIYCKSDPSNHKAEHCMPNRSTYYIFLWKHFGIAQGEMERKVLSLVSLFLMMIIRQQKGMDLEYWFSLYSV